MSGGAIVGLSAVVGVGLVFAAAFFWLLPREENPGPLQTLWGYGLRGTPEMDVARQLQRMKEAAEQERDGEPLEGGEALPPAERDDDDGERSSGRR
jgi:hypothetical protein